jgi:hypothetical protein
MKDIRKEKKWGCVYKKAIKSLSIDGELAKQYFFVYQKEGGEKIVEVRRLILAKKEFEGFEKERNILLREYKGCRLYGSAYGIKLDTLITFLIDFNNYTNKIIKEYETLH